MPTDDTDDLKASLKKKRATEPDPKSLPAVSSGLSLLNLACTGRAAAGFPTGKIIWVIGDSDTGKSWLCNTVLAEAANDHRFDGHDLIYDNSEKGGVHDLAQITRFWGSKLAARIRPPRGTWADPQDSEYLEDFYDAVSDLGKRGRPFVWIEDSMDALQPRADAEQFEKEKANRDNVRAGRKGKEMSGSYGMAKAKLNASGLRMANNVLAKTGSVMLIVSQTKANVGPTAMFNPTTTSGGKGLKFYCRLQLWLTMKGKIKKVVGKKPRHVGTVTKVAVKKNHVCGYQGSVDMPFYFDTGIDDVGANIQYLIDEGHWKGGKAYGAGAVAAPEFGYSGDKEGLVRKIEVGDGEGKLRKLVAKVWRQVQEESKVTRKQRYT